MYKRQTMHSLKVENGANFYIIPKNQDKKKLSKKEGEVVYLMREEVGMCPDMEKSVESGGGLSLCLMTFTERPRMQSYCFTAV